MTGLVLALGIVLAQQQRPQTQADDYTRYELQDPGTQSFRIFYDVTATTTGATHYFNAIRAGAEETVHGVQDRMTGVPLQWELVDGARARSAGHPRAALDGHYIMVRLARPVPEGGEARVRIDKTYRDTASYFARGDTIIFTRSLGIKRNAVVLPVGYELLSVNHPSQIATEADGRIRLSFINTGAAAVPYTIRAHKLPRQLAKAAAAAAATPAPVPLGLPAPAASTPAGANRTFPERAVQDREIVYFLNDPETHSFRLYHDYTETRAGVDRYLNVVRTGSAVSAPSAKLLDTGAQLRVETLRDNEIEKRGIDVRRVPGQPTEVVVVWFDPVKQGQSVRLRIEETYTDPQRYMVVDGALIWDRAFGRAHNAVVLPAGWYLTASAMPATVSTTTDGRIRLDYVNDRPDELQVFIKARRK
ncbi:MAG TPA: hypothetical protein VK864_02980 [Longimicrobiales bacterium]|nr:hypothetical protein [Longimicrobiales bacterium]